MAKSEKLEDTLAQPVQPLTEAELKQIDEQLIDAKQHTPLGQFFSQSVVFLSFIAFLGCLFSYGGFQLFNNKLDQTQHIQNALFVNDFKLDLVDYVQSTKLKSVKVFLDDYWHVHDLRYDIFHCVEEPEVAYYTNQKYIFDYSYAKTKTHDIFFSISAHSQINKVDLNIEFDNHQEIVLLDDLCLQHLGHSNFICIPMIDIIQDNRDFADLLSLLQCNQKTPCTYRIYAQSRRVLQNIHLIINLVLEMPSFAIDENQCSYSAPNSFIDYKHKTHLLLKSRVLPLAMHEVPRLSIQFQNDIELQVLKTVCVSGGLALFITIYLVFQRSKKHFEEKIKTQAIEELRNRQKVKSHLSKIKNLIKGQD